MRDSITDLALGQLPGGAGSERPGGETLVIETADDGESLVAHEVLMFHGKHTYQNIAHVLLTTRELLPWHARLARIGSSASITRRRPPELIEEQRTLGSAH
ncbi:MAG: hypothetical protein U0V87_04065 [Acidobacteriota bacterium]